MDILTIHYNTPEMTAAAIRSLWKHTPQARVTVFDNSDKFPFVLDGLNGLDGLDERLTVIDNTKGQVVDWEKWLEQFPDKVPTPENNWGSAKHCYSIDLCMSRFPDGFILMDSDVLIKKDVSDMVDPSVPWSGGLQINTRRFGVVIYRLMPFLCWINVPMVKPYGIRYFNGAKIWNLTRKSPDNHYDTGASFLEECRRAGLNGRRVNIRQYIEHYGHASWRQNPEKISPEDWLQRFKPLWHTEKNLRIYVCTHVDFTPRVKDEVYEVVDARQFNGDRCPNGLHGSFYSELITYKYIAEREELPRYVGFCGYRKYYSFMDHVPDMDDLFSRYDAAAATPVRVKPNVREQYAACHNVKDLDIVTDIIRTYYTKLWPTYQKTLEQHDLYACNMFILRREDFIWLINTVFGILDKYLEVVGLDIDGRLARHPGDYHIGRLSRATPEYQYRIGGFLGERIVNALLRYRFKNIRHYDRVITQEAINVVNEITT